MDRVTILNTMLEIIEAIKLYQKWLADLKIRRSQMQDSFLPVNWYDHKIDIYERVINRLELRYKNQLQKLYWFPNQPINVK